MENVVSIRLEDFLEIRDRVLELEQELDNAYSNAREVNFNYGNLETKMFNLSMHFIKKLSTYKNADTCTHEEFVSIENICTWEHAQLKKFGLTQEEILKCLSIIWKDSQEEEEC